MLSHHQCVHVCLLTHTHEHTPYWACCSSDIQSLARLCADVSKDPILLLHCASEDRGPSLRAQGHRTRRHKRALSPSLCPHVQVCTLSLSTYHPCLSLSLTCTHSRALTLRVPAAAAAARSYSFTLRAASRQLLECPDLKCTEIATIVSLTAKYQASESGLSDPELPFIGDEGVQRPDHIEDWNHRGCVIRQDGKSSGIETLSFQLYQKAQCQIQSFCSFLLVFCEIQRRPT